MGIQKFFAEATNSTAASGGNRENLLGQRSAFCEADQGRNIKSAKRNPWRALFPVKAENQHLFETYSHLNVDFFDFPSIIEAGGAASC